MAARMGNAMTGDEENRHRAESLTADLARAQERSRHVMAEVVRAARMCAVTEERVAETLDHLADTQPHRADGLRRKSAFARDQAAREREWAEEHERAIERPD
jgi:hypothetical protein